MVLACKVVGTQVPHLMAEDARAVGALGQFSLEKIARKDEEEVEVHVAPDMAVNNKGFDVLHIPSKNLQDSLDMRRDVGPSLAIKAGVGVGGCHGRQKDRDHGAKIQATRSS